MSKIALITGSVRPGRNSVAVAEWVKAQADARADADYEVVDIADYDLPVWSEAMPPRFQRYEQSSTQRWSARIADFDGFVFVTGEYNHSISGALKNALDHLFTEFNDKAAGFVSYGGMGGARAVEHLRAILSELGVAHVRNQVTMPIFTDFRNYTEFVPSQMSFQSLDAMLDQLLPWTKALEQVRADQATRAKVQMEQAS